MPFPTTTVLNATGGTVTVNTLPNAGQALMASSLPVVLASDQSAIPVNSTIVASIPAGSNVIGGVTQSGTWNVGITGTAAVTQSGAWNINSITTLPALVAGTAIIGKVGIDQTTPGTTNLVAAGQSGAWNITNISGTVSLPTGASTAANQTSIISSIGATTDAAWASGNGTAISLLKTLATAALSPSSSSVNIDQTTDGTTNKVAVGNSPSGNNAKTYTGTFVVAGAVTTRPANVTAYSIGDSISNNATAASVTATSSNNLSDTNDHPIDLCEILLDSSDTAPGAAGTQIRVHLFNADPTASSGVVNGDNGVYSNKRNGWIGSFSGTMRPFSDGSRGVLIPDEGPLRMISPVTGARNLYYQLQTLGAFTPSANSTTFTPTFKGFQARAA